MIFFCLLLNFSGMGGYGGPSAFALDDHRHHGLASADLAQHHKTSAHSVRPENTDPSEMADPPKQDEPPKQDDPAGSGDDGIGFGHSALSIISGGQEHSFKVEVAKTALARERGLMFRTSMPKEKGMLFLFEKEQNVIMWMKNTYIPLDIVFINSRGLIVHIAKSTVPESLDYIYCKQSVISVLELNAGITTDLKIKIGDKVSHAYFLHD